MSRFIWRKLVEFDSLLVAPVIILLVLSLTILYSLGLGSETKNLDDFYRQLWFLPIGWLIFLLVSFMHHRWYYHYANVFYWFSVSLLVAVLLFGKTIRGTTGWFVFYGWQWQPVELVKILWVLWLASYFVRVDFRERPLKTLLISGLHLSLLVGLILKQSDLGSSVLLVASWAALVWLLVLPSRYLFGLVGLGLLVAVLSWFLILVPYQKERILTFVNPQADPLGSGYNVRQSIIAVGSGNLWGRGIGEGTQSHLQFLPESKTDFIFAVIGEELGLVGLVVVLICWSVIIWRMYHLALRTSDNFSSLIIAGLAALWVTQVIINIGMNLGLLPVTGLGLPFVSYGRSSLMSSFFALGIIVSISHTAKRWLDKQVR